jgi:thymidine kinase
MFAQKTTELMRRIRCYKSINYNVLVVNFIQDERYGVGCIANHDRDTEHALCVPALKEVDEVVRSNSYNVIAIDEGQFFPDLYEYVTQWADDLKVHIIVAGLDGDAERKPFGDMLRLIPHAEEIQRLNAYCGECGDGTVAHFTKFIGEESAVVDGVNIGGADKYRPVCRDHRT